MQLCRTERAALALATAVTVAAGVFLGSPNSTAAPTAPPPKPTVSNPTNQQLSGADAQKAALDQQVGVLSGQIAAAQSRLDDLQNKAEQAEQLVALTITEYRSAEVASKRAQAVAASAVLKVDDAQTRFAQYMQANYMDGLPDGLTGTLLTAKDPSALLDQTSYQQYEADHNAGVIGQMQTLSVEKSNAQARAERAKIAARKAQRAAEEAQRQAADAVQTQQDQQAALNTTMSQKQTELTTAKARVVQLYDNRATYAQYVSELNAYRAYVAEQQRIAAERRAQARAQARAKAAAAAARQNGDNNSGSDDPPSDSPPAPDGGGWTAAKARQAVARAKSTLGTPYAWAGGGVDGPSYGACVPSAGAPNDCYIKGYDCSGLVMYAWGQDWDHYADTQYNQAGSYHPSRSKLRPGDLVFFGYRGGGSALHHVAMYIGHGRIIEAPYSGGYVQYNDLDAYSDYYGATRPLT